MRYGNESVRAGDERAPDTLDGGDPSTRTSRIPPDLLERLVAVRVHLAKNGSVMLRRWRNGVVWRLRVRVPDRDRGRVHRSITVGDAETAEAVAALIAGWRHGRTTRVRKRRRKLGAETSYEEKVRRLRRQILSEFGGGSHRRERIAREFDEAAANPMRLMAYVYGGSYTAPNRKPGRKRKAGLS